MESITLNQFNIVGKRVDVDITKLNEHPDLKEVIIKNFDVDDNFVQVLNNIKNLENLWFINCNFCNNLKINNVTYLRMHNCKNIRWSTINSGINNLDISDGEKINVEDIIGYDLKSLMLRNISVVNLDKIEKFCNLEKLFLQEIDLNQTINYSKLKMLKKINFNGSTIEKNKEKYLEELRNRDIEVSFIDKNYYFDN